MAHGPCATKLLGERQWCVISSLVYSFCGACKSGFSLCPFGSGKPSTLSENRTTRLLGEMSADLTLTMAFITASATSLRAAAVRQALGSQAMCTCGIGESGGRRRKQARVVSGLPHPRGEDPVPSVQGAPLAGSHPRPTSGGPLLHIEEKKSMRSSLPFVPQTQSTSALLSCAGAQRVLGGRARVA